MFDTNALVVRGSIQQRLLIDRPFLRPYWQGRAP
jgi:hypothetical protein